MKKNFGKRIFLLFLSLLMVFSILPMGTISASAAVKFTHRTTKPTTEDYHYYSDNAYQKIGYGLPNCTAYAWGRAYEILGKKPNLSMHNANTWYAYNQEHNYYKYGTTPKVGAIACWKQSYGHVAVVEGVNADGTISISESNWSGRTNPAKAFRYFDRINPYTYYGQFQGYIYIVDNADIDENSGETDRNSPVNQGNYDANAQKNIGTYKNTCNSGANMRNAVGTDGTRILLTIPKNAEIYVYETNGNWGKITFAGKVGWVCLDNFTESRIPIPATPSISNISAENIAVGKTVTLSWNAVSGAAGYTIGIRSANDNRDIDVGNTTSYSFVLSNAEKYDFYVQASNVSGASNWSSPRSCTAHAPITVNFVDWDNTLLGSQIIDYGASAAAPAAPQRKGYTFQGWSDSFYNVTTNKTIQATYKIDTYTVNFFDREGLLIKSQKVEYGGDATPPTDTNETGKYKFIGWNSTAYQSVYTDRTDKTINIDGVYSWYNYDLPTVCTIKSAIRQYDGYYVTFDIENNDSMPTTGRAVVALKTAEGKLVDMTESTAFSIPAAKTKNGVEVFIPCNKVASTIEVFMVSDYSSGVPISPRVTTSIQEGLMYAESTVKPDNSDGTLDVQEVTQYSYRDKEFSTGNTKVKDGWTYTGSRTEQVGNWSGWSWSAISAFDNERQRREIDTQPAIASYNYKTQYNYNRWANAAGSRFGPCAGTWNSVYCGNYQEWGWHDYALPYVTTRYSSQVGGNYNLYNSTSAPWYNEWTQQAVASANYGTQYRYRDINYVYNFYRWKPWSGWSDTVVSATANRDVRTRIIYRYKSNNIQPEDTSGTVRTINGQLDAAFAGKQITLYVYGYTGASDYTNQYIGQSVVASDGSYTFTFKLREEPTVQTGDFTVAIGVEGTTDRTVIDTIEAPKPTYEVKFYDWDGSVISTQTVKEGDSAVLPENPSKEGYNFLGWDKSVANIREDTEFYADFEKKQYTVVFVDWENQQIEIKKFNHGDILVAPEAETVEGYAFKGWDCENAVVTQDMIVSAKYEANTYTIKFYDWNNNVIDEQSVKYGETAVVPDDPEGNGVNFADWFNPEDYQYVAHDANIYPSYYFDETTDIPTANYQTGEYSDKIQLTLTSDDSNAVIFYYLNGDETTERIYTEPIEIDKTCSVTYYATSFGKNNSDTVTEYYCINSGGDPSDWMLYSDLPDAVKADLESYTIESAVGYKYKDVQKLSNVDAIQTLEANGWTLENTSYTDYTPWQDEEIAVDSNLLGFEVKTRQAEDPSVKWYQYSHYKYTDNGITKYSPTPLLDGHAQKYETITLENRLNIAGFTDDSVSYYNYDNQQWFSQTRVNGQKTQYHSRYQVAEYYKWTDWTIDALASNEQREYQSDDVYRYDNKNYHIVYLDFYGAVLLVEENKCIDASLLDVPEGYDFAGLYTDEALTNAFDLSTPITESINLFVKYTPKKYSVIFQMQDGTELDSQVVEYFNAATAPDTDIVPGYVFGGWDKDFSCITEDIVITGTYFKESEYARISLDKENVELYQGSSMLLVPTITPSNLVGEAIEWISSDPSVVSVDDNGKITALSAGIATVTVQVVRTRETAVCNITVSPDKANFIILKSDSSLDYDTLGYLRRVNLKSSVENTSKEFANDNLRFFNLKGTELKLTDYIGTGTQVKLFNGENIVDTKTIVVTGDMTGDGIINNRDIAMMNKKLVDKVETQECQALAIDVNGDGYIDNKDAAMVARYLVGKEML